MFEGPSAEVLGQAGEVAELQFERIVEAVEGSARRKGKQHEWKGSARRNAAAVAATALLVAGVGLSLGLAHAAPTAGGARQDVADQFVTAANRGDYRTVCRIYSARYLKSQASCQSLYRWGAGLYGPFDYKIVRWRTLHNGHWRVDLTRWHRPSFIELEREKAGWRIVAGGW